MATNLDAMTDEEFERHMEENPPADNSEDTAASEVEETADTEADEQETSEDESTEGETESHTAEEEDKETEDTETSEEMKETNTTEEVDYKTFYEQVTADYKANKKVMPGLKSPDDIRAALAMASNYALKTTALKPHMGRIKMLEGISDDELNEMMDFKNRNPEVIKKALKEAGIDPLDIDVDKPVEYKPNNYVPHQSEVEFDEVISEIKDTPEFARTAEVVTKVWDAKSKQVMLDNPKLIVGLNEEIQMGRFETIQGMIEQRKMLGKTGGMTDLEMYQEIATEMNMKKAPQEKPVVTEKPTTKVEDPVVKEQKKQAGISAKKTSTAVKKYDPTKLSDEEFMKLIESGAKFI